MLLKLLVALATAGLAGALRPALAHRQLGTRIAIFQPFVLRAQRDPRDQRRIIRRDNLGEPIYEGEEPENDSLFNISNVDPVSATLLIFGLIAFNFFVIANL